MMYAGATKYLYVAPALMLLLALTIYPTIFAYYLALHDVRVQTFFSPSFIGLDNLRYILGNDEFWYSLYFTASFAAVTCTLELIIGLLLALLVNRLDRWGGILVPLLITPLSIAPVVFAVMMRLIVNDSIGPLPLLLRLLGIEYSFLSGFWPSFTTLVITDVLQWTPFVFIIIYAGLRSLPNEITEASQIDGASYWNSVIYIVIPMIRNLIAITFIFRIMDAVKTFDIIHIITAGGPGASTTSLTLFTYKRAMIYGNFGLASATTIVLFYLLIGVVSLLIFATNKFRG